MLAYLFHPKARTVASACALTALVVAIAWLASRYGAEGSSGPFVPSDGTEVLERVREKNRTPRADKLESLRARLSRQPENLNVAVDLARLHIEESRANNDPRHKGYAAAVLAPWLQLEAPPPEVLVLRATLRQSEHDFDGALQDLKRVLAVSPRDAQAWVTLALILQVRGQLDEAKRACMPLFELSSELAAVTCHAGAEGLGGNIEVARDRLRQTLAATSTASAGERLWALTLLGELHARLGDDDEAESTFKEALALGPNDAYLLGAYADLLLRQERHAHVIKLLEDHDDTDALLLRLALAEQALAAPSFAEHRAALASSFERSRARGDVVHSREEARYALEIEHDPGRALGVAVENWRSQREPADAALLLQAALATGRRGAAEPVLAFLEETGLEDVHLSALAKSVRALPKAGE